MKGRNTRAQLVRFGAVLCAAGVFFSLMATASMGQEAPLTFTDQSAAAPSSSDLTTGFVSTICNTSASPQVLTPSLQGFHFTSNRPASAEPSTTTTAATTGSAVTKTAQPTGAKRPVGTDEVLSVSPVGELGAGQCRDITVVLKGSSPVLSDPTYSGVLLVTSASGASARRTLTIPGTAAEAKPVGAVNNLDLQGAYRFKDPRGGSIKLDDGAIALTYAGTEPPVVPKKSRVGVVANGSDVAILRSTEDSHRARGNTIVIPVELVHASGHGTFKGTLDTKIAGTADKPIAISVTVADGWSLPLAVLILGLLIGLVVKLAAGKWIPRTRLMWRRYKLADKYTDAGTSFTSSCPKFAARYGPPTTQTIEAFKKLSKKATKQYNKTTLIFDSTSADLKKILDDLAAAEKDAGVIENGDLCEALKTLDDALDNFAKYLVKYFPKSPPPAVATKVTGILGLPQPPAPVALPVGGATKLIEKAKEALELLATWTGWADDLRRYQEWARRLDAAMSSRTPGDMDEALAVLEDHAQLRAVANRLVEAHNEMLDAVSKDDMEAIQAPADLKRAFQTLASLGARYGVWVRKDWVQQEEAAEDPYQALAVMGVRAVDFNERDVTAQRLMTHWETDVIPVDLGELAEDVGAYVGLGLAVILEVLILFAAGGLALITAVRGLYVDKPFGSWDDYLAVLALGVAAEAVIGGFVTALQAWRNPAVSVPKT